MENKGVSRFEGVEREGEMGVCGRWVYVDFKK
jgi:hypothetical protein